MKEKKWFCRTILYLSVCLAAFAAIMIVVDPYFHFHGPIRGMSYRLYEERYINNGIARHFQYDAIITGTSMTQNFKTSEFNELFESNAVKLPFSGGSYREISQNLQCAFSYNPQIKKVLWGLDGEFLIQESNYQRYEDFPTYLYDDFIWNDIYYVLNKSSMYHGSLNNIVMTLKGEASTTFDEYSAWEGATGYEAVMGTYVRKEAVKEDRELSEEEKQLVEENIATNICSVVEENPNTTFYFFFTPYSIVRWNSWYDEGRVSAQVEAEAIAAEMLLQYPNVELYCFYENTELIHNLDYYKDSIHYNAEISSRILQWMQKGEYRLTEANSEAHAKWEKETYLGYSYGE